MEKWNVTQEQINALKLDWSSILTQATQVTTNFMGSVFNITVNVANGIFIMAMSFIFCMYMLVNKEKLTTNLKRVMYAYLPNRVAKRTIDVAILSNKIFSNFVRGQLTEACIWFFLIYLGMTVLRLPYALLISAIVALCSLIPIIAVSYTHLDVYKRQGALAQKADNRKSIPQPPSDYRCRSRNPYWPAVSAGRFPASGR